MPELKRNWFFQQGRFFIIYKSKKESKFTLLLGPNRLSFLLSCLVLSLFLCYNIHCGSQTTKNQFYITIISSAICFFSFLYTGMVDPGIVWPEDSHNQSDDIEQNDQSVYCSICGVYRPSNTYHCVKCNVCIRDWDHHCSLFGTCIAKNNQLSFIICIFSSILCLLLSFQNKVFSHLFNIL